MKIAVVGDVGIDYYTNLNLLKPGGIAFNLAYNLKTSGVEDVSIVSILGSDEYSKKLLKLTEKSGVNIKYIQATTGNCPKQNILLKTNERKFVGYDAGVLKKWKLRKKDIAFLKSQNAIFVPINDGMEHIFNAVKKVNGPVKAVDFSQDYEFADFDKKNNIITKNAKYFGVIFVGGTKKHQHMIEGLAKTYPEKVFVLTLGKYGSMAFYQGKKYFKPVNRIKKIVDTTGCGDAFQAAFLSSWLLQLSIPLALKSATKNATTVIRRVGSTSLEIN